MSKNHRRGAATCAAACCRHNASMNLDLSFFRFPKDERRRTIWAKNSGREDLLGLTAEQCYNYRLCSIHFADVMFWNETRTRLLPLAVPTVFLTALGSVDKLGCYIDEVVMNSCSSEDAGTVVNPVINDAEEITEHVDSCTEEIIEIDEAGSANYLFTFDVTVPILRDADYSSIENESLASELQPESAPTPVCLQKNPKGKYISSAQKKMAYDVYKRNLQTGGNSKSQCVKLTSVEVGFGITTVWKIVREIERDGVVSSPVRKRKRKALYKELDEYQKEKISQIVYTCFENNETLTTAKVYRAITEDESFPPLSRSSVWRILKKFGYIGEHRDVSDDSSDSSEDDVPPPPPVSNKRKRISKPKNQTSVSEDGGSAKKMKTLTSIKKSSTKTSNQSSTITSNQSSTKTSNQCSTITSNPSSTKTSNQSSQKCNFEEVYIKEEPIEETAEEVIRNPIKDEIDENINNSDESRPNEMKKNNPCLKVNEENTVYIKQEYIENEELDRDMNSSNVSENRDMINGKSAMNIDNLNIKEEPIEPDSGKNELFNVVLHNIKKEEL